MTRLVLKAAALTVALKGAIYYLHLGRGVPVMFGLFLLLAVIVDSLARQSRVSHGRG